MCVTQNNQSAVVCDYTPVPREQKERQSEEQMEQKLISDLENQGYEYIRLNNLEALKQNLRESLEKLNDYRFTHNEWEDFYARVIKKPSSILEKAEIIQENWVHTLDCEDGRTKNIYLLKKDDIHANRLQVTHQHIASSDQGRCRYDVSLLVNGLPLVHIELKARGVSIREAFHQIDRYRFESFGGSDDGLFEYVQIFVISNGTLTRYYSNTTRQKSLNHNVRTVAKSTFEFTSHWADAKNRPIQEIEDFTKYFATEKILDRIAYVHNAQEYGKNGSGGYIWHTTGSGKTLTSFKTAILATKLDYIHKVLFVVDRKDLDDQTVKEYEKFQKGSVSQTGSTRELKRRLEDHKDKSKIIVTTIQKLRRFIESNKDHSIFNEEVVLIFDECHRNHQGDMHRAITKYFKKHYLFGFTGTSILNENNSRILPAVSQSNLAFMRIGALERI